MTNFNRGDKFLLPATMVEGGWVSIGEAGGNQTQFKNNMIDIDQIAIPANRLTDLDAENTRLRVELDVLRSALTPSGYTKFAYAGEFKQEEVRLDENGDEYVHKVIIEWTTIKDIMAAIRALALNTGDNQ